jgi:hypothetical protein
MRETAGEMNQRHRKERERINKIISGGEEPIIKEAVLWKASTGDEEAYLQYNQLQQTENVDLYKSAQNDIMECIENFNEIADRTVMKSGETPEQLEARIWMENPGLYERLSKAQHLIANLQKASR